MTNLVFVYGSLKRGFYNSSVLGNSEYVSNHVTDNVYTMYDIGLFPAAVDKGNTGIHGELYRVSDDVLEDLDMLEGVPVFYHRTLIKTKHGDAIMYLLTGRSIDKDIIDSGIWRM